MQPEPADRYQTVGELWRDLEAIATSEAPEAPGGQQAGPGKGAKPRRWFKF